MQARCVTRAMQGPPTRKTDVRGGVTRPISLVRLAARVPSSECAGRNAVCLFGLRAHLHLNLQSLLYLAVVIDLCSRRIVGWATQSCQTSDIMLQGPAHQSGETAWNGLVPQATRSGSLNESTQQLP